MSLIEEALRRVKDPTIQPPSVKVPESEPPRSQPKPVHPWASTPDQAPPASSAPTRTTKVVLATGVVLAAILVIGVAFWMGRTSNDTTPAVVLSQEPIARPPRESGSRAPAPLTQRWRSPSITPEQTFVLSGVVEGGQGEAYAVINGEILGVGEAVEGATLLKIVDGSVQLRTADGDDIVLRVPR